MNEQWMKVLSCRLALLAAEAVLLESTGWTRTDAGWKHPEWASSVINQELAVRETSIRVRQTAARPV